MATYSYELFVLTLYNVTVKALQAMWSLQMLILKQPLFLDTCKCTAVSHKQNINISWEHDMNLRGISPTTNYIRLSYIVIFYHLLLAFENIYICMLN